MTTRPALAELESVIGAIDSPWLVPFNGSLDELPGDFTSPDDGDHKELLVETRRAIRPDQRKLFASRQYSILLTPDN